MSTNYPHIISIKNDFSSYLVRVGISKATIRNYRSDITHFLHFIFGVLNIDTTSNAAIYDIFGTMDTNTGATYKEYMLASHIPQRTINRRLATLRHFSTFLRLKGAIKDDFVEGVQNVQRHNSSKNTPLITQYRRQLIQSGQSKNTIKNYISDVRHFLNWVKEDNMRSHTK